MRPLRHIRRADGDEDDHRPLPRDEDDADPRGDLEHVVGRRHQAGPDAAGDALLGAAGLAQARQVLVHDEVARLAAQEQREAHVVQGAERSAGSRRPGRVDEVAGQQAGEDPVEERVAEDVEGWHGAGGEVVQEGGLELTLDEVRHEHVEARLLHHRHGQLVSVLVEVRVDLGELRADRVEECVEEDRPQVLDEEDGSPCHLRAWFGC